MPTKTTSPEPRRPAAPIDPLTAYISHLARHPVPLIATHYDIATKGGFATVAATRRFRNAEAHSIEATITFPVPVNAVLHHLDATIGGRMLIAIAQGRAAARETYEAALDRGKTAVLHEELLRGVHMLSIGHIAPATEITVTARWSMLATHAGGLTQLRIPLTVGDIYGQSGLPDADDLAHGGPPQQGTLSLRSDAGTVRLNGAVWSGHGAPVAISLDAPIDIELDNARFETISGRMADGRPVSLLIEPAPERDTPIDAAILIDHSGSMASPASGAGPQASKHSAVLLGLSEAAAALREGDGIALWEFDDSARLIGEARNAKQLRALLTHLSPPSGGTEIGSALSAAAAGERRDVILVTDGKSHALDVQAMARTGCRFTVVLVGEDSLEAHAGHLAALTGGSIFAALGADIATAVTAAIASVRAAASGRAPAKVPRPRELICLRSGFRIGAAWSASQPNAARTDDEHAVAALAASLLLPSLDDAAATELAIAENLVCHLTSLVLVDEAGATADTVAAQRKIALPSPRTDIQSVNAAISGTRVMHSMMSRSRSLPVIDNAQAGEMYESAAAPAPAPEVKSVDAAKRLDLAEVALQIDWQLRPQGLIGGDLSVLPRLLADAIRAAAKAPWLVAEAKRLGLDPAAFILGLMARCAGARDRLAARVARGILRTSDAAALDAAALKLGLPAVRLPAAK